MINMKHLNTELIAAILDKKIDKDELVLYQKHINECEDCLVLYSSIKSNINNMKNREEVKVPKKLFLDTQSKLLKEDSVVKKIDLNASKNIFNNNFFMSLSIAACFAFIFYLGNKQFNSNSTTNNFALEQLENKQEFNISRYKDISKNKPEGRYSVFNKASDSKNIFLKDRKVINFPNFKNLLLNKIIDSLNTLNINYTIIKKEGIKEIEFSIHNNHLFDTEKDSLIIFVPNN